MQLRDRYKLNKVFETFSEIYDELDAVHENEEKHHFDSEDGCYFIRKDKNNMNKAASPKKDRKRSNTNYKSRQMLLNEVQEIKEKLERMEIKYANLQRKTKKNQKRFRKYKKTKSRSLKNYSRSKRNIRLHKIRGQ